MKTKAQSREYKVQGSDMVTMYAKDEMSARIIAARFPGSQIYRLSIACNGRGSAWYPVVG